jgi:long-subunit fatty acid transport protein
MKHTFALCTLLLGFSVFAKADLYYVGDEPMESLPIKWSVGGNLIYDDNVAPGRGSKEDSMALNPFVGASWTNLTAQTSIDVYARLGLIYYFDAPTGIDDMNSQSRLGLNVTHRFTERLRWVSRNAIAYELEPDYSRGVANSRTQGEFLYWQMNNALGFRWTERFGTYTGLSLTAFDYRNSDDNDRFTWEFNNQFRYQLSPQTVLTADYRYQDTSARGNSGRDSSNQFALLGVEHRFNPNTVGVARVGVQHRDVSGASNSTNPNLEFALTSRVNDQLRVRAFSRYSMESYDTVRGLKNSDQLVEFAKRDTFRIGIGAEYTLTPKLSFSTDLNYIPTTYKKGVRVDNLGGPDDPIPGSSDDDLLHMTLGIAYQITDSVFGTLSYSYTNSSSDLAGRDYNRSRVSMGVRAEF